MQRPGKILGMKRHQINCREVLRRSLEPAVSCLKQWLAKHAEQIEVFYLPSYSPELNPDEYLNADQKDGVKRRAPARTRAQLNEAAISHLRKLQNSSPRVRKYFEHKSVRHAA
jgi:transposase